MKRDAILHARARNGCSLLLMMVLNSKAATVSRLFLFNFIASNDICHEHSTSYFHVVVYVVTVNNLN